MGGGQLDINMLCTGSHATEDHRGHAMWWMSCNVYVSISISPPYSNSSI